MSGGRKHALVLGAGGFIGAHLVRRLIHDGCWVRGVDLRPPAFSASAADEFIVADLRDLGSCRDVIDGDFDEVYQLAADMGGAGYIFTGVNDADLMVNSVTINANVLRAVREHPTRLFFASSACVYADARTDAQAAPVTRENSVYPANPDSNYGWEKLVSERMYLAHARNHGIEVRIARLHNVFGPEAAWRGGREKAPAALCRKVAEASNGGAIEIWGDGRQMRSFLYIDEAIDGILRLMHSNFAGPVNIGSDEMVSIDDLARMIIAIAGKRLRLRHVAGPVGVRGRNSDNALIRERLNWSPGAPLRQGLVPTYAWILEQVRVGGEALHAAE